MHAAVRDAACALSDELGLTHAAARSAAILTQYPDRLLEADYCFWAE